MTGPGARFGLTMLSAIGARGALRFSLLAGTPTAAGFLAFLTRLVRDTAGHGAGPVCCLVDHHPVHRGQPVARFVDSTEGQLRPYRLPASSPRLNPDEWVWQNVQHGGVAPPPSTARSR